MKSVSAKYLIPGSKVYVGLGITRTVAEVTNLNSGITRIRWAVPRLTVEVESDTTYSVVGS